MQPHLERLHLLGELEAVAQQYVALVHHHRLQVVRLQVALADEPPHAPGGADDDVAALREVWLRKNISLLYGVSQFNLCPWQS